MDYGKTKLCIFDVKSKVIHSRRGPSVTIWLPQWDAVAKGAPVQKCELTELRDMVTKGDHIKVLRINAGDSLFTQARQLLYLVQEVKAMGNYTLELSVSCTLDDLLEASQEDLLSLLLVNSFDIVMSAEDARAYSLTEVRERYDQLDFWCGYITLY